uniref:TIL domain-containing protein n=1 Tax=Tetranychus urticae TaxID=32264 RepID=T1KUK3_TETUR
MKTKFILTFIVFLVFITVSYELYVPRKVQKRIIGCGTACPRTCSNPKIDSCIQVCTGNPECPEGYFENNIGKCVLWKDFSLCEDKPRKVEKVMIGCGSACPLTCKYPEPRMCIQVCTGLPECPRGYYENHLGECVLREDC